MTKYVLEILDGDQAGTTLELPSSKLRMGRRADNDLVLRDEKCSGHHAEIVFEDGGYVLRDLDSTNGSLIDGRKISEVALSNLDIFQVGRVRIRFQAEGAGEALADMQVSRLDRSSLAKKKTFGLGSLLLVLLLLAGAGALAWLEFLAPQGSGLAGPRERPVLVVAGNSLDPAASNFEADETGWDLQIAGSGFEAGFSGRDANSGTGFIEARPGEEGAGYALARTAEAVSILAGTPLRIRGFLRTEGSGLAALRVVFSSQDGRSVLRTGSTPDSYPSYEEVELIATVPQGMDMVSIEVLGLLPGEDALVACDDVALISDRSLSANGLDFTCRDGRSLRGVGGSLLVGGQEASLLGIRPFATEAGFMALDKVGLLVPSDMGLAFTVEPIDKIGFQLRSSGEASLAGMIIRLPVDSRPCLTLGSDGSFVTQEGEFSGVGSRSVLLGHGADRLLIEFDADVQLSASQVMDGYDLRCQPAVDFKLFLVMDEAASQARELLRLARTARSDGLMQVALESLQQARSKFPHDESVLRDIEELRREIIVEMEQRIAQLREGAADAAFFRSRSGYRRIRDGIQDLIDLYGEGNVLQVESLRGIASEMGAGLAELESLAEGEHRARMQLLVEAFREGGQDEIAALIEAYLQRGN